jgi:alanine racemase
MREAALSISRAALQHNLQRVRECMPESRVLAMIKADAYGHGALVTAEALSAADGFGVAFLQEAQALRAAGISHPVTVLEGVFTPAEMMEVVRLKLATVVHQNLQVQLLEAVPAATPVDVWLKLDTGMHRLGFASSQALAAWRRLRALPGVRSVSLVTHFARADEVTAPQPGCKWRSFVHCSNRSRRRRVMRCRIAWPIQPAFWRGRRHREVGCGRASCCMAVRRLPTVRQHHWGCVR